MPTDCISYQQSGYFSSLIIDYLNQNKDLETFYNRFPNLENFEKQIEEKKENFNKKGHRFRLVSALKRQNSNIILSEASQKNLNFLEKENTYTVTTGHQLTLFTGPLYFIYKIISTIILCRKLQEKHPQYHFVPVYWMATEDHDFEEINHFKIKGKKITWNQDSKGPVGRLATEGLNKVYDELSEALGQGERANFLKELFKKAYLEHDCLSDATRYLVNSLFSDYGLLILDGDDSDLKKLFIPFIESELKNQHSFTQVTQTLSDFKGYPVQVNPREINLFYIENGLRERIIFEDNKYVINNTSRSFTETEILSLVHSNPEKFSPNVILRPVYQELILPNLCYIGGGGELAYWFELKQLFDSFQIPFPILLLRNSVLLVSQKWNDKREKLALKWSDLFLKSDDLLNRKTREYSQFEIDFSKQKEALHKQFEHLHTIAKATDPSFSGAVKAQEVKQTRGLENLEKRLLKAEKRVLQERLDRILDLQDHLFPNQGLQERQENFATYYLETEKLIPILIEALNPIKQNFSIIIY